MGGANKVHEACGLASQMIMTRSLVLDCESSVEKDPEEPSDPVNELSIQQSSYRPHVHVPRGSGSRRFLEARVPIRHSDSPVCRVPSRLPRSLTTPRPPPPTNSSLSLSPSLFKHIPPTHASPHSLSLTSPYDLYDPCLNTIFPTPRRPQHSHDAASDGTALDEAFPTISTVKPPGLGRAGSKSGL
jgi:hypothetical protein